MITKGERVRAEIRKKLEAQGLEYPPDWWGPITFDAEPHPFEAKPPAPDGRPNRAQRRAERSRLRAKGQAQ
jgi:hypothetical protein